MLALWKNARPPLPPGFDGIQVADIFVRKLILVASEESVRALFETPGAVGPVNIVTDRETGQLLGFGFFMADDQEGETDIAALHTHLDARAPDVCEPLPKPDRQAEMMVDGVVLSVYGSIMRVAMRDRNDAAQFTFRNGQWLAEDGLPVSITFLSPFSGHGMDTRSDAKSSAAGAGGWVD